MYSIKAKTTTNVIPTSIVDDNPKFVEFLELYYEWQTHSNVLYNSILGNFDLVTDFYSLSTLLNTKSELVNESNKSYTVKFDSNRTFIPGERVVGYRRIDDPLRMTFSQTREYVFNGICCPKITMYYGQKYTIKNDTGERLYIKTRKTFGSSFLFEDVENNGTIGEVLTINVSAGTPRPLYYTVGNETTIGIIDLQPLSANLQGEAAEQLNSETTSIFGFGLIENILFNPEYIVDNYDKLTTIEAPDAFFYRYLQNFGLEDLFSNNFRSRRAVTDFLRFFKKKGTEDSIRFFFRNFFGRDVSIAYPGEKVLRISDSRFFARDVLFVITEEGTELTRNRRIRGQLSGTTGVIETYTFDAANQLYKLYLNKEKTDGKFVVNEPIFVIDDDDSTISYDIKGVAAGVVYKFEVVEPGLEYTRGEQVTNTYTIAGDDKNITFTVEDVTSTEVKRLSITNGGTNYSIGDAVRFIKPTKKLVFYGIVDGPGATDSYAIPFTIQAEASNYVVQYSDYSGATLYVDGFKYTIDSYDGSLIGLNTGGARATVAAGKRLFVEMPFNNVTDSMYDANYFHPSQNTIKREASGFVSSIGAAGEIESIQIKDSGTGYIKRPNTTDGSIVIDSTVGTGATVSAVGQNYGGILTLSADRDVYGINIDFDINITRTGTSPENDAKIRLRIDSTSKYGEFFVDNTGFISDQIFIHDSYFYQDFSYVIRSDLNYSEFAPLFKKLSHPAGMVFFNEFFIERFFRQKLNRGTDFAITPKTIRIEKLPNEYRSIVFNHVTVKKLLYYWSRTHTISNRFTDLFHWQSENFITLNDTWNDGTDVSISTWSDQTLKETTQIPRSFDENWIDYKRTTEIRNTSVGTGDLTVDLTETGDYTGFLDVTGTGTLFTQEIGPGDIIELTDGHILYVRYVTNNINMVAQGFNTTLGSVYTGAFSVQKRMSTELNYSTFSDLIGLSSTLSAGTDTYGQMLLKNSRNIFTNV